MSRHTLQELEALIAQSDGDTRADRIVRYEQAFHDEQSAYYDELHTDPEPVRTYFKRLNDEIFELVRGAEFVVDLCSGTGKSSLPLLERGVSIRAVDVSYPMLKIYQRKAKRDGRLVLIHADATNPPLLPESCPAIIMIGGLHHIPNREAALANACRALRTGGLLIIHEPVSTGRSHWLVPAIRNLNAITDARRVARRIGRAVGVRPAVTAAADERLDFTPFERSFKSPDELIAIMPRGMQVIDLRSKLVLSDCHLGQHFGHLSRPLAKGIVAIDNWLSKTDRAGWTGNALWAVLRKN